jgi:hypothetical protein
LASFNRDSRESRDGERGQRIIERWLRDVRGCWVVRSYDYIGPRCKAPMLFGPRGDALILPDLEVFTPLGKRHWLELKTKHEATEHRNSGTLWHGFSGRQYQQYQQVQRITRLRIFILFYEMQTGHVTGNWLHVLDKHKRVNVSRSMREMVFFPLKDDVLRPIAEIKWNPDV